MSAHRPAPCSACTLCRHHVEVAGALLCAHPDHACRCRGALAPVHLLRAPGDLCGPNALHMQARDAQTLARPL